MSDWEDVAIGPSGSSDDAWEDVGGTQFGPYLSDLQKFKDQSTLVDPSTPGASILNSIFNSPSQMNDRASQMLKGFLPGGSYVDAGLHAAQEGLLNLFGAEGHKSFGDAYDERLGDITLNNRAFEETHPGEAMMAQIGGTIINPLNRLLPNTAGMSVFSRLGTNAAVGGGLGAAYGAGNEQTEDPLKSALLGGAFGAVATPALSELLGIVGSGADKLIKGGESLARKSLGLRSSDYLKTANDINIVDLPDGNLETLTKNAVDDLLASGKLGTSRDPSTLLKTANENTKALATELNDAIAAYNGPPIQPNFDNTLNYLAKGKVPANDVGKYIDEVISLGDAIKVEGKGSLPYLQNQKLALREKWNPADKVSSNFYRALYSDLQSAIESAVPKTKDINQQIQKYKILNPVLRRSLGIAESQEPVTGVVNALKTTGGNLVGPTLAGGALGGVQDGKRGAAAGALAGLALGAGRTPAGMSALSSIFSKAGSVAEPFSRAAQSVLGANVIPGIVGEIAGTKSAQDDPGSSAAPKRLEKLPSIFTPKESSLPTESTGKPMDEQKPLTLSSVFDSLPSLVEEAKADEPKAKPLDTLLDAVKLVESGGNPNAKSPAGAKGAYQFTDATAKDYGLKNPFDEKESRIAAEKKIRSDFEHFGDMRLALAAYNAGRGRVDKLLKQVDGDSYDDIEHLLPVETRAYIPKITKKYLTLLKA